MTLDDRDRDLEERVKTGIFPARHPEDATPIVEIYDGATDRMVRLDLETLGNGGLLDERELQGAGYNTPSSPDSYH